MTRHASLTGAIDKGPSGPRIGAFFDLDRTLIAGFSAGAFVRELVRLGKIDAVAMAQGAAAATRFQLGGVGFSGFVAETADLPLLDSVGWPRPINPSRALSAIAAKRGWPARRFTSRGTPQPREVVRTALAAASALPSFLLERAGGAADRRLAAGRQSGPQHLGRAWHGDRWRRPAGAGRADLE